MSPTPPFELVRSRRKTTAIYIRDGKVEVRTGLLTPRRIIDRLVQQKQPWIERTLTKQAAREKEKPRIIDGADFYLQGIRHTLRVSSGKNQSVTVIGRKLEICTGRSSKGAVIPLSDWLKAEAEKHLTPLTQELASRLGENRKLQAIRYRKTRSKWGHCSRKGVIQYNWQIMQAPEPIIYYLACHEVCHLKEMNHSKKFWALVESLDPDFKKHRKWLRVNQHRLAF